VPTSDDYSTAASRFRSLATTLESTAVTPGSERWGAFGHGPVADAIEVQLSAVAGDVAVAAAECRRLAAVCAARAEICAQYRQDMYRYWIRALIDPLARRPTRPAPWVDL
jgi:hypothetical protein